MLCGVGTANQRLARLIQDAIQIGGAPVNLFKEVENLVALPLIPPDDTRPAPA